MLRIGTAGLVVRRAAIGVGAAAGVGGGAVAAYASTEQGLGLRREYQFWKVLSPVIFDYWWHASSSSPYIKYQEWLGNTTDQQASEATDLEKDEEAKRKARRERYRELHDRNAPRVYQVILDLGGLYIKLGQVLSVTALPIPDQYRELFRELQSTVPGHEEFETVVRPTLERELGRPIDELFTSIDEVPCGAASIGQAHRATLRETGEDVIVKVQYPHAKWMVPADIQCVGDFMNMCVWFGIIPQEAAKLSYDEFSRQFLSELDYEQEANNLNEVYQSSLDPSAPYARRGVVIPRLFPEYCTKQVVTMTYLPGPKFEEEAKQQLALLGFDTKKGIRNIVRRQTTESTDVNATEETADSLAGATPSNPKYWQFTLSNIVGKWVGVDSIFSLARLARRLLIWYTSAAVASVRVASRLSLAQPDWEAWADERENSILRTARLDWTHEAVRALVDVHGYQILDQGLFNGDPHPGNILVVQDEQSKDTDPKLGLIDYGQCKRLTAEERARVAKLIVSVADNHPDEDVAAQFRSLGIQTKNDSTEFLAGFAHLMFGAFKPEHLSHAWHKAMHKQDQVLYFPNELSMVYRTSILLRGLAMSLQLNVDVAQQWRQYAQAAIDAERQNERKAMEKRQAVI